MLLLLLLVGCLPGNSAPRIEAFNGVEVRRDILGGYWIGQDFAFTPGETVPFELDAFDPEGDQIAIWWPWAPPGFSFDPWGSTGAWVVSEDFELEGWAFTAVVVDDALEPAGSTLGIWFGNTAAGPDGPR